MSTPLTSKKTRRPALIAAASLAGGAILANVAFIALGAVFDYPDVLSRPTAEFVAMFQENRAAVMAWFAVLATGAALLAPGAWALGRLGTTKAARWSVIVGVLAAVVQVIGLSRWFLLVPGLAAQGDAAALEQIELAHTVLGQGIGETLGYILTATWTALVIVGFPQLRGGRIAAGLGFVAAGLIALGVLAPWHVPGTDMANFIGYVLWSLWVLVLAGRLVRSTIISA